jgi:hypothetical protein
MFNGTDGGGGSALSSGASGVGLRSSLKIGRASVAA